MKLKITGSPPRLAIYTNGDDSPFTSPLSNLSRVRIHSDLDYIGVVQEYSGTFSFSSGSLTTDTDLTGRFYGTIATHGLGYSPLIIGYVVLGSQNVPLPMLDVNYSPGFEILADTSKIFLSTNNNTISYSYTYKVWATNWGIESGGSFKVADNYAGVEITPTRVRAAQYDTNANYIYADGAGTMPILTGRSASIGLGDETAQDTVALEIYKKIGSYSYSYGSTRTSFGGYPEADALFTAPNVLVSK